MTIPRSTFRRSTSAINAGDLDFRTTLTPNSLTSGDGLLVSLGMRSNSTARYVARVRLHSNGTTSMSHVRVVGSTTTVMKTSTKTGVTYAANQSLNIRVQVEGASPTTLRTRIWRGTTEPTTWQLITGDSATDVPRSGAFFVDSSLPSSASATVVAAFDNLSVTTLDTNQPPTAAFTSSTNGLTLTVNGAGSRDPENGPLTYAWNFGDGATATGPTATRTYPTGGTRTVRLTVTDNTGQTATTTRSITTAAPQPTNQPPTAAFTSSTNGLRVDVNGTAADPDGTIASRTWDFGDGATENGPTASHTYNSPGTYTVTFTATDNSGAATTATRSITVAAPQPTNQAPTAAFTSSTNGLKVDVNGTGSSDPENGPLSYAWDFGDGATATGPTATRTYTTGGTRTVRLTVTDNTGQTATTTRSITTAAPQPVNQAGPNAQNTGVISTQLNLLSTTSPRPYPGDVISGNKLLVYTPNAVYEGWRFDRIVEVHAPNVTFRDCSFEGVNGNPANSALLIVANDRTGGPVPSATVEDSSLIPAFPNDTIDGFRGSNTTLRRVEISKTVDGAHVYGSTTFTDEYAGNVLIVDSWIHDLTWYNNGSNADGTHNDGVQVVGGKNIQVVRSRIDGAIWNAGVQVTQARNKVDTFQLRDTLFSGGSCTVNISEGGTASAITGIVLGSNTFVKGSSRRLDCAMLVSSKSLASASATGNLWHDQSMPVPVPITTVPPMAP